MSEVNNFDVLKRLSIENKRIWLAPTITDMNYNAKRGTKLTFGVAGNVVFDIQLQKKNAVCLLWSVAEFNEMKATMEHEKPADAWISAKERPPATGQWVWIVYADTVQPIAYGRFGRGFACQDGYEWRDSQDVGDPIPDDQVTHWMPMAAPPAPNSV